MAPIKYETYRKSTDLIKARFSKLHNLVVKITSSEEPLTPVQIRQLNTVFTELKKKRDDFEGNLARIIEAESEQAVESTLSADVDSINDLYVSISSEIEVAIAPDPTTPASPDGDTSLRMPYPTSVLAGVKLPKLNLLTFDGSPLKWITYINLFDVSVHKNTQLSNIQKMQYLISTLENEPLNLIKSFNLTPTNYLIAYNLLRERYHNKRRLTTLHLNHLLDLETIQTSNPKHLRTFITTFYEHSECLKALDCEVTQNNPLLSAHLLRKLDTRLVQKLEHFRTQQGDSEESHSLPTVEEIIKFLNIECSCIEDANLHSNASEAKTKISHSLISPKSKGDYPKRSSYRPKEVTLHTASTSSTQYASMKEKPCFCCEKIGHKIYQCQQFKNKSPNERYQIVRNKKRCNSCLGDHHIKDCRSQASCLTCSKKHHTLLHFNNATQHFSRSSSPKPLATSTTLTSIADKSQKCKSDQHSTILLGTTLVKLIATNGKAYVFRALLDSGSMSDFVSERAAQLLGTRRLASNISISGVATSYSHTKGLLNLNVQNLSGLSLAEKHPFHILEKIAVDLPRVELSPEVHKRVCNFTLADPTFHLPGPVDVLLGASLYPKILTNECHSLGHKMPYALGTLLGYVILGCAPCTTPSPNTPQVSLSLLSIDDNNLHASLQRFWTQEELPTYNSKTLEETQCDEFFEATHQRDSHGRYIVRLPFQNKDSPYTLGQSKIYAEKRFHSLEQKLNLTQNQDFRKLYVNFIEEYETLGHMHRCDDLNLNLPHYYLPHHGVLKDSSSTTKLRVVFDASAKTTSGSSLNDLLFTGPKLQNNICDLLVQFRLQNIVLSCDIRQMYRQIKVHSDDQPYQLILWRNSPSKPISTYKLNTVTYGMNCSPYLAIKTLQQLAEDEGNKYPMAANVLKNQSYVDDLITGAPNVEEALELQNQLIKLLKLGGFELRKWISNAPELLCNLPLTHQETPVFLQPASEPHFSILGMYWSPISDSFKYKFSFSHTTPTKRKVLSLIAKIYDPCGFLAPCVMTAKRFMQLLWISKITWDEPLNKEFSSKWNDFITDMKTIAHISISRTMHLSSFHHYDLHGFSDASENGFAAVIYLRCSKDNEVRVSLIIAKTRAAPLKRITLPRLELCAAHLLAQLAHYVLSQLTSTVTINSVNLWTDSTVVLAWLQTPPYRLKTYVANRVAQTQELFSTHRWKHISTKENPADCASRGISPSQLLDHPLWWHGPSWLQQSPANWPSTHLDLHSPAVSHEMKTAPLAVLTATSQPEDNLLHKYSSWTKLLRVTAYILRFIANSRRKEAYTGPLSIEETQNARRTIFRMVQQEAFQEDIISLSRNKSCSSRLRRLAPFFDKYGLLRVGGRLHHTSLSEDIRHPYILPKKHHIVTILIDYTHIHHLHSGAQLTQALLFRDVWILSARSVIRSRIFQCITCFKIKPHNTSPLMGDLPKARVTATRPFQSTGVDYGGPFTIKLHNLKAIRHIKAYICVFICLATKAVHIEVVTDLSSDAFIAALTRFVARRGLCHEIYSDCATNFVGAKNALHEIIHSTGKAQIQSYSLKQNINFRFNPPAAPHHGGLWESAIKSAKYHLKRVLGTHVPTLAQFHTLTCQVESMLNSRPLTALSNDPSDLQALTPGHFLIGTSLSAVPEPCMIDIPDNRLNQWQLCQAINQRIWKRWSQEYLHTLQQRLKWSQPTRNLQIGDLVLIQQDTPSMTWPLARISHVIYGHDNVVRVVEAKTAQGTFKRPAVKVFRLPLQD